MPDYYENFQCTGPACEYSCCVGWTVNIDKATYFKYKKTPGLAENLKKWCKKETKESFNAHYADIILDPKTRRCPMLGDDCLCKIQKQFGENYLSVTCRSYPRGWSLVSATSLLKLNLSCPEVARLAVLRDDIITFKYSEVPYGQMYSRFRDNYAAIHNETYAMPVLDACIDILQSRTLDIPDRLLGMGMMCKKLDDTIADLNDEQILRTVDMYRTSAVSGQFAGAVNQLQTHEDISSVMSGFLLNIIVEFSDNTPLYKDCLEIIVQKLMDKKLGNVDESGNLRKDYALWYSMVYEEIQVYWNSFLNTHGTYIENYLTAFVFNQCLPFKYKRSNLSLFDNFMIAAQAYALVRMVVCLLASKEGQITDDILLKTIYNISRALEHNPRAKMIAERYKKLNIGSLPYAAFLLKT
jgi:lysine-N-methylase